MASGPPSPPEPKPLAPERGHRPVVSLAVLAGVCVAFALLFFQVIRPLALPLFLAAVFAIMVFPLQERLTARCGGRGGLSALLIVSSLILLLLGPTIAGFVAAYGRASDVVAQLERPVQMADEVNDLLQRIAEFSQSDPDELRLWVVQAVRDGEQLLFRKAVQTVGDVVTFALGLLLFAVSGFFFLKDGTSILKTWEELTPLNLEQDRQLRQQFAVVCRAVVLSTILAALAQAITFGLSLGLLDLCFGVGLGKWLVLLVVLAFVFSMVPMVGPSVIWIPLAAWMLYEGQYAPAVILTAIGMLVVSNVDNLVRMAVLKGSAGMHPLLALVSSLGGLYQMGVLGVFLGPILAGVFLTLLRILRPQLDQFEPSPPLPPRAPAHEETASLTAHKKLAVSRDTPEGVRPPA